MRRRLILPVLVVALGFAACGGGTEPSSAPVTATAVDGPYRLTFTMPRATWAASDAISGTATLALTSGERVVLSGSGAGPIGFGFTEVGGDRQMGPAWTADCALHPLSVAAPIVSAITKSGGWSDDQPDAAFYRGFFSDPETHLPEGVWDVTALAEFSESSDCSGGPAELRATIRLSITP